MELHVPARASRALRGAVALCAAALCLSYVGHARGDGLAGLMVSKSIPPATVAVIDPESGSSSGGSAGTDLRLAPGDVILFRLNFFAMPDRVLRGMAGYLTELIPPNTEVVGVRILDAQGRTIRPSYPGIAMDGCPPGGCSGFNAVPCSAGVSGCSGGTRDLADGSIAQVYADTGVFYSTDPDTRRVPSTAFLTYSNGLLMTPREPVSAANIAPILGIGGPFYGHTAWDVDQIWAYGIANSRGNASGNQGSGNTPFLYGSPVAGPQTFYRYEATDVVAGGTDAPSDLRFDDNVGPWQRVRYPGSLIGTGSAVTGTGPVRRQVLDTTAGFDVRPANPIPSTATALRVALGELRAGDIGAVEVALRVRGTPIDPVHGADVDCAELFGGGTAAESASGSGNGGRDNPWGFVVPSPQCVYLNLLFDLTVDRPRATGGDVLTYTLHGKNLSTLPQTNVVVRQRYDGSRVSLIGASVTGAPVMTTCAGQPCLQWTLGTLDPGEEYTFTSRFTVGGTGQISNVEYATYTSDQLPSPGFQTQAVTLVRPTPLLRAEITPPTGSVAPGGLITLSGTLRNEGTQLASLGELTVVLPSGFTLEPSSITLGGTVYAATAGAAGLGGRSLAAGASLPLSFRVRVPAGAASPALHDVDLQVWLSSSGYGGSAETYFPDLVAIPVGAPRSDRPVLDCPILSNATRIRGTTSEADGTDVRAYFNLIQRGVDTDAAGGRFDVGTFGAGTTFGALYGGLEVTATAQAPGELESLPSDPCYVTHVAACQDGLDNDGDGLVDFPADPGCSSPTDGDERDPQCSDGIDNDGDGLVDWPADPECAGPDDGTEGGPPACSNGIDDDGDGLIDFPADPDCTSASDRTEVAQRRCSNGIDDDGDGLVDFGSAGSNDPGCHSANDDSEADFAYATGDVRARILLVFDTSGSMNWHVCADEFTGGDGSLECAGGDVACAVCGASGCGNGLADDSRIARARAGVADVVAGFGDVEMGLMRFHQRATGFVCPTTNATAAAGGWAGAGAVCGSFASGDLLVGFSPENEYDLIEWLDGSDNYGGTPPAGLDIELRGSGTTPLAGSLDSARTYLSDVRGADPRAMCRPYRVILLTDGAETCGGTPSSSAAALRAAGFPVHVIGFANAPSASAQLDSIASSGGTGSAIFVDDSTALSTAIANIVNDAILTEVCNGADDDCDTLIDEGFVRYCDRPNGVTSPTLCVDPGEHACDGVDDNCDGRIDEGLRNACGTCGAPPTEVCNFRDDDCDGRIDEAPGTCASCVPGPETCDGADQDCDGRIDEGLTRPCGTDVGACTVGTEACTAGAWGACSGIGPTTEACNGVDDDCDGVIDGLTRPCGSSTGACVPGVERCSAGSYGACVGAVGPGSELCNSADDDCDGRTDEGNPGGGAACGSAIGACRPGMQVCTAGMLVCSGGTGPSAELCNGIDDDCDGTTDEGVPVGGACGACGGGVLRCVAGMMTCTGDRSPAAEICNGADDDCDGTTDEGDPGGGASCGTSTGACDPGTTRCVGGRLACVGGTSPAGELCNTLDDDCDGIVDEGNPEGGSSCGASDVGECERGVEVCTAGALACVGESGPSAERCDGLDNDCDAATDEGDPGGGAACGDDTGECSAGTTECVAGALVCTGAVGPTEEVCNMLDDDCDGVVDDGLSLGAPCGTDRGECVPGVLVCRDGATVCDGAIGPMAEACNALDDDCDGPVDEGLALGAVCGETEGACVPGMLQCVAGREVCVGEVPRGRETCDCEDDDCDGAVDEAPDTGELCPPGSTCIDCSCALPCVDSEFMPCPSGRVPQRRDDGMCFCVAPRCDEATCAGETITSGGEVACAPSSSGVPVCTCRNNECTFPCDGVDCPDPTVCHPDLGVCVMDDCRALGCPGGFVCDVATLACVEDPCASAGCAPEEACRAGTCEPSCATVRCPAGERCASGVCVDDPCDGVACSGGTACDPASGLCVVDLCVGVLCPRGEVCEPVSGECRREPCADLRCPEGEYCRAGECESLLVTTDAGVGGDAGARDGGGIDAGDGTYRVLAAGGGGCTCSVPGRGAAGDAGGGRRGARWALALLLVLGTTIVVRRRAR